jgi:HAMP domain-containing protein
MNIAKILVAIGATLVVASASAQTATPVVTERQQNEAARINQGVASGELTKKETAQLRTEQRAIRAEKKAFKADGKVTAAERAKLRRDQNAASRHIYNKKHNAKKAA